MNATWDLSVGTRVSSSPRDLAWVKPRMGTVTWLAKRPMCIEELGQYGFDVRVLWDGERHCRPAFHGSVVKVQEGESE